jgi:transposase
VLKVDTIRDPEKLRRVALLLDRTVDQLQERVRDLAFENARLRGETAAQVDFSFPLKELEKALAEPAQEPAAPQARSRRPGQPGHGPSPQANLPTETRVHELPPNERDCTVCGGTLEAMAGQSEDCEEITVTERSYRLVLNQRQKYRCRCNGNVVTAPGPLKLIPGGRYSLDFAVHVAVQKYGDHLPLERQVEVMSRHGLTTTSQALWDQIDAAAQVLRPSYESLGAWLLAQPLVHADETGWPVQEPGTKKPRWTAWGLCNAKAMWFRIASSKSEKEGQRLLGTYRDTVVADGYQVYKNLARGPDSPGYRLAHCWAHVLRKFREAEPNDSRSRWMLERIGDLYAVERESALAAGDNAARHLALRQQRAGPLLAQIRAWALGQGGLRRSSFGKALAYMLSHWAGLVVFLEDAGVPLDNNRAERALRGLVLGRKNHYGSRSQRGADVSALFYSLIGTAKITGLDPAVYLRKAISAALTAPGTVTLPF